MKIKLRLSSGIEKVVRKELENKNIEISDDAPLVLTEEDYNESNLICKDTDGIGRVLVSFDEICYIESLGKDVFVHVRNNKYKTELRIYQLELILPNVLFVRISNSIIIKRNSIEKIKPTLGCKFILTLVNGDMVDVTRTYYHKFKEFYGI